MALDVWRPCDSSGLNNLSHHTLHRGLSLYDTSACDRSELQCSWKSSHRSLPLRKSAALLVRGSSSHEPSPQTQMQSLLSHKPGDTMTIIKKPGKKIEKFYLANKSITGQFDITGAVTLLAAVSFPAKLSWSKFTILRRNSLNSITRTICTCTTRYHLCCLHLDFSPVHVVPLLLPDPSLLQLKLSLLQALLVHSLQLTPVNSNVNLNVNF